MRDVFKIFPGGRRREKNIAFFLFTFIVENFFEILFLKFVMGPTVGSVRPAGRKLYGPAVQDVKAIGRIF